jgi:hypothetical protein
MAKFESPSERGYTTIMNELWRWTRSIKKAKPAAPSKQFGNWTIEEEEPSHSENLQPQPKTLTQGQNQVTGSVSGRNLFTGSNIRLHSQFWLNQEDIAPLN